MSIGQIITTAQGMAVVVEVLPTSVNLGNEALRQVVAEPLTGGPPPPVPAVPTVPGEQPLTPYQAIMAQAAAAYVAFVATQLDLEEWSLAAGPAEARPRHRTPIPPPPRPINRPRT